MNPFDGDMASFIHAEMRKNGINLMLNTMVEGFSETDHGIDVKIKNASAIHTDMVVMAIGVSPETTLAKEAGLELGIKGSIVVNHRMETSVPDIYAVGDAVQIRNFVTDTDTLLSFIKCCLHRNGTNGIVAVNIQIHPEPVILRLQLHIREDNR